MNMPELVDVHVDDATHGILDFAGQAIVTGDVNELAFSFGS